MTASGFVAPLVAVGVLATCSPARQDAVAADSAIMRARAERLRDELRHPDSTADHDLPLARWELPGGLREISGLALTADGRLLTHDDNRARVYEVDYRRGVVVKAFTLGDPPVRGDFEAIAVAGDTVILLTSDGMLYRFREGANGTSVEYAVHDTGLGGECEFEGLAFDPADHTLVLACKRVYDEHLADSLVLFRLSTAAGAAPARLTVPLAAIIAPHGWKGLRPSDITIDPSNGNYLLVASREHALVEITPRGELVFARSLPPGHAQPEGLAITRDSILLISDEAGDTPALLTLYRWP